MAHKIKKLKFQLSVDLFTFWVNYRYPLFESFDLKIMSSSKFNSPKYLIGRNPLNAKEIGIGSSLDNLLANPRFIDALMSGKVRISFLSPYDLSELYRVSANGTTVNTENFKLFGETVLFRFQNKIHETTDHLIIQIQINPDSQDQINIAYLSLENSVRSTNAGCDFGDRWPAFERLFEKFKENNIHFVFGSEAGRDIFAGNVQFTPDRKTLLTPVKTKWAVIRSNVAKLGYNEVGISMNNDDEYGPDRAVVSFGLVGWALDGFTGYRGVIEIHKTPINSFGSGSLQVTFGYGNDEFTVVAVHFPLNFAKGESENPLTDLMPQLNAYAVENKVDLLFGDMNTVVSNFDRYLTVKEGMKDYELLMENTYPTFFSSFYDTIPDEPMPLLKELFE
jgi:hypothetical protein